MHARIYTNISTILVGIYNISSWTLKRNILVIYHIKLLFRDLLKTSKNDIKAIFKQWFPKD